MEASKFILVVDDDEDIRTSLHEVLEDAGFETRVAADGVDALGVLQREPEAAVILLDLMMPTMNGWQLMKELKGRPRLSEIPILLITADAGAANETDNARASGYNAQGFLKKPFKLDALLAAVKRYV